jgi:hypothetical protein
MSTGERKRAAKEPERPVGGPEWTSALDGASFPSALWSGADLQFRWANRRFLELLWESQSRFDRLGMPMRGFLSDADAAIRFQDAAYTGQPYVEPAYRFVSQNGEVTFYQLSFLPVPGAIGDPSDVLVTAIDATADVLTRAEDERRRADLANAEGLIQRTILSSLDAEDILQRSLVEATEAYGADWGWIALREVDAWVFRNVHGWPAETIGRSFREDELSMPRLAADARGVVMATLPDPSEPGARELLERFDVGAFLLVPLYAKGEVRGVMGFCWNDPMQFTAAHRELGDKLSLSLTLALENARAYGDERYIARTLRSAFFHVPCSIPGLDIGHLYRAAGGTGSVGGDFYDVMMPEPGRVGMLIGDVAGHGIGVASLASLIKSAMHASALQAPSPRRVLAATNDMVLRSSLTASYASAFFGLLETGTGAFSYCSAGHPEPVLVRPGSAARSLVNSEMVLGVREGSRYSNHRATVEMDDLLVLYTDGLTEARDRKGRQFGKERLFEAIEAVADAPACTVPESLFLDVFSFTDGELEDDIAIVALRRNGREETVGQERLALGAA